MGGNLAWLYTWHCPKTNSCHTHALDVIATTFSDCPKPICVTHIHWRLLLWNGVVFLKLMAARELLRTVHVSVRRATATPHQE